MRIEITPELRQVLAELSAAVLAIRALYEEIGEEEFAAILERVTDETS